MTTKPQDFLTTEQAAAMLGMHPGTLQNWRSAGMTDLKYVKIGGKVRGKVRYRREDVEAYMNRTRTHT
jgi:excisionase family DNA binding protein